MFPCLSKIRSCRGFTLHEAIVTIAIMTTGTLSAVGVVGLVVSEHLTSQANELLVDVQLTRSEAIQRNARAMLCKSRDSENCTTDSAWHEGWIVFVDANANQRRDVGEVLLRVHGPLPDGYYIKLGVFGASQLGVTYLPTGLANYNNGTFTFCHQERGRAVILNSIGRPRVARVQASGAPLVCP